MITPHTHKHTHTHTCTHITITVPHTCTHITVTVLWHDNINWGAWDIKNIMVTDLFAYDPLQHQATLWSSTLIDVPPLS